MSRIPLPEHIAKQMRKWRELDLWNIPADYIQFHADLAYADLGKFPDRGLKVHDNWMADDGWLDGMKVVHAVIELSDETLKKIKWSDQNQGWMERLECGGWGFIDLSPVEDFIKDHCN